jgi:hypothetical protein
MNPKPQQLTYIAECRPVSEGNIMVKCKPQHIFSKFRIEIRQRLEGEDINLHLFAIRVLEDEARYEVKLSGDAEHRTVKPPEWLSLLHDKLARIVAKILYARETSKPEKQELDVSGPAA